MKTTPFIAAAALGLGLLAACGKSERPVDGSSPEAYQAWFARESDMLPDDQKPILREAEQEIRLNIMAHTHVSGADSITTEFLQKVDGMTAHQFMVTGLNDRIARLTDFRDEAKRLVDTNSKIVGANPESTAVLNNTLDQQREALQKTEDQLASTRADLAKISAGGNP